MFRNKLDKWFHIDRSNEYGHISKSSIVPPDSIILSKKNLFLYERSSFRSGAMILNPRSKFIMKRNSFASFNLCVCPGNHMVVKGMWKRDITDAVKDKLDKNHKYDQDIIVEEDVWIGINVTLLNGAHIGRGCVVGAGCVLSGEWPPYAIIVGNPARVKRFLFTPEEILEHEEKLYAPEDRFSLETLEENVKKYSPKE